MFERSRNSARLSLGRYQFVLQYRFYTEYGHAAEVYIPTSYGIVFSVGPFLILRRGY